ncbi:SDR family NAD(P)-dependent oxidoreductase [Ottowia thiooxydans]|uniref:NAD(P)-dependent dehydrogenase (Short-subunit alcohol dehydrogenase family) n=1 Tax=Ottowia thiooxydans TaxID=219182 RepID=A0ABV2QHB8_9BURK
MSGDFATQVAVVTGGGKGIGRIIALALAREGADVLVVGRDAAALEETCAAIRTLGQRGIAVAADVTQPEQVARLGATIDAECAGQVDVLVTAAGTRDTQQATVDALDLAQFDAVIQGNLNGTLLPVRCVLPFMKARRQGKIVAISGVFGLKGQPGHAAGCSSKWAVEGLVRVLAREMGPYNINVNAVCPGYVEGPRADASLERMAAERGTLAQERRQALEAATALGRLSTADDVANAALFLASARARNITGRDLIVDAGWML